MLAVEVKRKWRLVLNRAELGALIRLLWWYLNSRPATLSLPELANVQRVMKLGQKLQYKIYTHEKPTACKVNLNVQEASSLQMVMDALRGVELGVLERTVVYKLNDTLRI